MPESHCPRCHALLREEDCCVYEAPSWMKNLGMFFTVQIECWACTWVGQWQAANVIKAEEKALS